jgi:hypothetical protein
VGDEEVSLTVFVLEVAEQIDQLGLDRDIQRADGFDAHDELRFDGEGADRLAGSFGWWAAWRESGCAVFVTNGGPMFADVTDPEFLEMIGEDADTDIFANHAI